MRLPGFHVVLLLVTILSRKKTSFQIFLGKNWKSFSSHNYFDPSGLFMSVLWSGPLLVISMIILVSAFFHVSFSVLINTLFSLCYLIVRWKIAELKHLARAARDKKD
ncbi:Transmembrane protein 18 [Glycine soja]